MQTSRTPGGGPAAGINPRYADIGALLDEERRALLRELDHPGFADADPTDDPGVRLEALEVDQRRHADLQRRLAELDAALDRLQRHTYGRCEGCGTEIPLERLEAVPTTEHCVACAARQG